MSIPRLPSLCASLLKPLRSPEAAALRSPPKTSVIARHARYHLHAQSKRYQSTILERYGPAIELPPPSYNEVRDAAEKSQDVSNTKEEAKKDAGSEPERLESKKEINDNVKSSSLAADEDHPPEEVGEPQLNAPLEKVMQMPAPSSPEKSKPPHLEAPPWVHHFDTYTLVKDLGKGGFTQDQSITMMKSVRSLLAANLELARDGLVSKSDIENVCPLLRASCDRDFVEGCSRITFTFDTDRACLIGVIPFPRGLL